MELTKIPILAVLAFLGIPGAIMGLCVWRIEKLICEKGKKQEEKEAAQEELQFLTFKSTTAAIALAEATARAVQRIPDAHCNGDMHDALEYAAKTKHEQKDFLTRRGIEAVIG